MKRSRPEAEASGRESTGTTTTKKAKVGTSLGDQLARMVDNPACADVEFLVVGNEGTPPTPVYASKVILVARSPVFEALLSGNFREGQPPPSSASSSSSSTSSTSSSVSTSEASSSLAQVFWHRAEIRDMEPRTMRHLLHCLYTDQLHPDLVAKAQKKSTDDDDDDDDDDDEDDGNDEGSTVTQQERDLMALYVVADRYLVDKAKTLVRRELVRRFNDDRTNVMPVFDLALAVAPELASACQPIIEACAWPFLNNDDEDLEARWLGLSDAAAARVIGMDLNEIDEIEVFDAIQRRYQHHLAEAQEPGDDGDGDDDDDDDDADNGDGDDNDGGKEKDNGDDKKKEKKTEKAMKKRAAIAEAKKRVADLVKGIKTCLLSVDELTDVVEPSGLFTDAQLLAAYRHAARTHCFVIKDLPTHNFCDQLAHGEIRWSLNVRRPNASEHHRYAVELHILPTASHMRRVTPLSAEGVKVKIYCDRRCVESYRAKATTLVDVPGVLTVPFTARPSSERMTILVRLPTTAFRQIDLDVYSY